MKNLAIIPARSGSKGVPGKNIKRLGTAPLLWYTIEAAMLAGYGKYAEKKQDFYTEDMEIGFEPIFDTVVVTSDSDDILNMARKGFQRYQTKNVEWVLHKRNEKLAMDHVQTDEVLLDVLRDMEFLNGGINAFDNICLLQPTSPFRDYQHITESYEHFSIFPEANCLISGVEYVDGYHWKSADDGIVVPIDHNPTFRMGRQWEKELPTIYRENGAIYWFKSKEFSLRRFYRMEPFVIYPMTEEDSIDINTIGDWIAAEQIVAKRWGL